MTTLVQKFSYPNEVDEVVRRFVEICIDHFKTDDLGVLLIGSASRGELSWSDDKEGLCIYSDIEFLIVVPKQKLCGLATFEAEVSRLNASLRLGNRFKIDYVVNSWDGIPTLEKRIIIFDSKQCGIEYGSKEVAPLLPEVTRKNINFKELNDVLLHRMKALLNDVPVSIFSDSSGEKEFCMSIAKNALDLTTWLHPYEARSLVSGFANRVGELEDLDGDSVFWKYFKADDINFLRECLAVRSGSDKNYKVANMLARYISLYESGIGYCKEVNSIDSGRSLDEPLVSAGLFWEYSLRRRLKETYLIFINFNIFSLRILMANIFMPRKGKQVTFCFSMIKALIFHLQERDGDFGPQVTLSKQLLARFISVEDINSRNAIKCWLSLRSSYAKINRVLI
jgi:hypothetical protein